MIIWLNLLIPITAILILLLFFKRKIHLVEYLILLVAPAILIGIIHSTSYYSQTRDIEYWNSYLVSAEYYEYWSTWDHETCTRQVPCGTDSEGNTRYRTETYDCSHCDENRPYWSATDNLGNEFSITQEFFEKLCVLWGKREFVELNRHIVNHFNCGKDGDKFITKYNNKFEATIPLCIPYMYENRVQGSKSIFNFRKVSKNDVKYFGLYDYKDKFDKFEYNPIYGFHFPKASKKLQIWNGLLGSYKKVHMMILVFIDKPLQSAIMQEAYWKNGNKNEFILCIGIDKKQSIKWTKVITWSEKQDLKVSIEKSVLNMPFKLDDIVDTLAINVQKRFVKKSFKDFNYLSVEPSETSIIVTFIITLIITIIISIISIRNETDV